MESIIVGGLVMLLLIVGILLYCGMIVAAKDDEDVQKMLNKFNSKKKGGK